MTSSSNPPGVTRPAINYPWLLAVIALFALLVSKGFRKVEPLGPPQFVGPLSAPVLQDSFLLRAKVGTTEIGNAFAVSLGASTHPIVLTAMHRFGPAGGLAKVPGVETVAAASRQFSLRATSGKLLENLEFQPLPIGLAGTLGNSSDAGDIAGFSASGDGLTPARLAKNFPEIGSAIWLAIPGEKTGQRSLRSMIFATDPEAGLIYYRLPANILTLAQANANTGAPIINPAGEVLGIHIGAAGEPGSESTPPYGLAQSTEKFLPHILQALNGPHQQASAAMASTEQPEPE